MSRRVSTLGDSEINSRMSIAPSRADRRASEMPSKRASMAPRRKSAGRRSMGGGGRHSIVGDQAARKLDDPRPIKEKAWQKMAIQEVISYLVQHSACPPRPPLPRASARRSVSSRAALLSRSHQRCCDRCFRLRAGDLAEDHESAADEGLCKHVLVPRGAV